MNLTKGNSTFVILIICIFGILFPISYVGADETTKPAQCYFCDPNKSNDCPTKLEAKDCDPATDTYCFTQVSKDGVVLRGCGKDGLCTDNTCTKCTDSLCNNQTQFCKTCDATDANCAQSDVSDIKYNKVCDSALTKCVVKINQDKKVERRCAIASDDTDCETTDNCKLCDGAFCNKGIYPEKRRHCYQCSGSSCNNVEASASKTCLNYVENDICYSQGTSDTTMKRGCKSDPAGDTNPCSEDNKEGCSMCSMDNCNNLAYEYDQTLKCVQCKTTDTDKTCLADQSAAVDLVKNCEKKVPYTEDGQCYTSNSKGVVQRGCLLDQYAKKEDCKEADGCTLCSDKDGCNSKEMKIEFTCIVCRSDDDRRCWNDATKFTGKECRTTPSSAAEGCFHGIFNGNAIRGCMVDADERMQYTCKDPSNASCRACYEKDCNTGLSDSGATALQTLPWLTFGLVATMLAFMKYN